MTLSLKGAKVALYTGPGAELFRDVEKTLRNIVPYRLITAHDIRKYILRDFQLLIMPGGYTANYIPNLKPIGCEAIRTFLFEENGRYLGICAGAYITNTDELGISKSQMIRKSGIYTCDIQIQVLEHPIFQNITTQQLTVYYQNGPHIQPDPSEQSLALYSDGLSALIETSNSLIFSWHPEKLPHTTSILFSSIEYLLKKQ